ncbi:MAG: hypothetical protein F2663_01645 [Actinobacteria bacterium]|uniref:Unannotated protein n=1 Tax=freshwater metagenome TaxID=449393 RepID=A0A6J6NIY6_9ZZZZ|nr:hypothetical protein [Actinomycetota bacterium]
MIVAELRPAGPYSLRLSARHASDATRRFRDGVLTAAIRTPASHEIARAIQRPDGTIVIEAPSQHGIDRMRFMLGIDDDHTPFLERFADDPMVGPATKSLRGLRPLRTDTVTQALLRAFAGQLILAKRAREIERNVIRAATPFVGDGLHAAPVAAELARFAPAELRRLGLGARRGSALVRILSSLDPERLHGIESDAAAVRLDRERGLGPWSVGVVFLEGLGRFDRGLARDLGLVKLAGELWGRHVEAEETDVLLEPYGEFQGIASVYLLAGYHAGLVPLGNADRNSGRGQDRGVPHRRAP